MTSVIIKPDSLSPISKNFSAVIVREGNYTTPVDCISLLKHKKEVLDSDLSNIREEVASLSHDYLLKTLMSSDDQTLLGLFPTNRTTLCLGWVITFF